ncbi:MAG: acyl--CoA ligase [Oscillospiraceae bacterium]|nr:acyl--CoA ligase [Oscillospiraceae bacterium]
MKQLELDRTPQIHPYPETTMFGAVEAAKNTYPNAIAYDFQGKLTSYTEFVNLIEKAAKGLLHEGIRKGDRVTICMPNTPQGIICLYALNRIGAIANMVHPLSAEKNITFYLDFSKSKMILTLDMFYEKVKCAVNASERNPRIIVARIQDELPFPLNIVYRVAKNGKNMKFPDRECDILWTEMLKNGANKALPPIDYKEGETAVILYSGGTSGKQKGICLSDKNFNALGMQISEICGVNLNDKCKFLSVMPIFHGFGLGIGIHTILVNGARCILVPQFTIDSYAKTVIKKKPNFIAGVPTLYQALFETDRFNGKDLSFLVGVFSGGDALSPELKKRADKFLKEHNADIQIREGYGLTECVTASCVTPFDKAKLGSIGLPLRDMQYKIVEPGTFNERNIGEDGEIILTGPTLMSGYLDNEEETAEALQKDQNGTTWLFTGDMGYMDEEGFVYFKQRIKRMIITSGYNVYPSRIEDVIDKCPDVNYCCVIGVKDMYKMQKIRAYIVLNDGVEPTEEEKQKIKDFCKPYLDRYEWPKEIEFRDELPKTLVGKVAYHTLEEEAEQDAQAV